MREIRFKAKRLDNGEWATGCVNIVKEVVHFRVLYAEIQPFNSRAWVRVDPATVCQFTGLKDKNGVDIFEGDVCEDFSGEPPIEIRWDQFRCGYSIYDTQTGDEVDCIDGSYQLEILRNVHDKEGEGQ